MYVTFSAAESAPSETRTAPRTDPSGYVPLNELPSVQQDEVDNYLEKQRGLISRPRDSKL